MQNAILRQLHKYKPDTAECRKETQGYNKLHIHRSQCHYNGMKKKKIYCDTSVSMTPMKNFFAT